jgi:hypothetical protein
MHSIQPNKSHPLYVVIWWSLLVGVLLAFRWPLIWFPHEIYVDESQLIAGALTLRHDPVFWRSVDGTTAGPLDQYVLLPTAFFSGTTCYAAARITAVLLISGMLFAAGETVALIARRAVARVVILPPLAFEALTTSPELVHYSSELLPDLLLALAVWMFARQSIRPARGNLWAAALLLGMTPFAKLQAAPIAAALGLLLVYFEIASGRRRNITILVVAALLPTLLVALLVTVTNQTEHLLIPYFIQNMAYAQNGRLSLAQATSLLTMQSVTNGYHALWFAGCVAYCAGVFAFARNIPAVLRCYAIAGAGLLVMSIFSILSPGRAYHHYLNLLTFPLTFMTGIALSIALRPKADSSNSTIVQVGLFLLCGLVPQLAFRAVGPPEPAEYRAMQSTTQNRAHQELVALIKSLSSPGESLGLWGWRSALYIETGLYQATREAHTASQFVAGRWQGYYLRRYYHDLVASFPPVFVDTAGPGNFHFSNRTMGHEIYPQLSDWIDRNYQFVAEIDGVRVYRRRSPQPSPPVSETDRSCQCPAALLAECRT